MIEIMTVPSCEPCKLLKEELVGQGVDFIEYNCKEQTEGGDTLKDLMVTNEVPAVFISGEFIGVGDKAVDELLVRGYLKL